MNEGAGGGLGFERCPGALATAPARVLLCFVQKETFAAPGLSDNRTWCDRAFQPAPVPSREGLPWNHEARGPFRTESPARAKQADLPERISVYRTPRKLP